MSKLSIGHRGMSGVHRRAGVRLACLGLCVSVAALAATIPTAASAGASSHKLTSLKVILPYFPTGEDVGTAVAVEQGYYKAEGLTVTLEPGNTNTATGIDEVTSGSVQIGQDSSSPSLIQAISQGVPLKAFGAIFTKHPFAFYSLPTTPLKSAKDFLGKTIGTTPGASILIDAMLYKNGLKKDIPAVNKKIVTTNGGMTPLVHHQVQIATSWANSKAYLKPLGTKTAPSYHQLLLWSTGVHLSAVVLFATTSYLKSHKKVLEKYLAATAKGWIYARTHLAKSVSDLVKLFPNLTYQITLTTVVSSLPYVFNKASKGPGFASVNPKAWEQVAKLYRSIGQNKTTPTAKQMLTLSILAATKKARTW